MLLPKLTPYIRRMSSKQERLLRYLEAGDIDLSKSDVAAIDKAGAEPYDPPFSHSESRSAWRRLNCVALLLFTGYIAYHWLRIEFSERREYAY